MGILGSLTKLWKKKNKLRSKVSVVSREIDKMTGMDQIWDLPGAQLKPDQIPEYSFSGDTNNVLRLGYATVNAGGSRATSPFASANGKDYPSRVISDTLTLGQATPPSVAPAALPVGDTPTSRLLSSAFGQAMANGTTGSTARTPTTRLLTSAMNGVRSQAPAIANPLPGLRIPSNPGLSTIATANARRPYTA